MTRIPKRPLKKHKGRSQIPQLKLFFLRRQKEAKSFSTHIWEEKTNSQRQKRNRLDQKRNRKIQLINEPGTKGSGKENFQQLEKEAPCGLTET